MSDDGIADIECTQQWTAVKLRLPIEDVVKLGKLLAGAPEEAARGHVNYVELEIKRSGGRLKYEVFLPDYAWFDDDEDDEDDDPLAGGA